MEPARSIVSEGTRYELISEIASGGMATVYRARAAGEVERQVALKRIHPYLAKRPAFRAMFLDEARIVARIDHPNVCRILDYGESEGEAFIAMELLSGVTLQKVLVSLARKGPTDRDWFRFVTTVTAEAAAGLHAAHEARASDGAPLDIVHRDISPSNLFLTHDGLVKVLDFGIAKARDRLHESSTGEVKGKFSYMPPEQLHGRVDRRADVWSLGVVYYELLTLQPLFRRDTQPETIIAVERAPIAPPGQVRPPIAHLPWEPVMGALERDPERRLSSAEAFADRLHACLEPLGGLMSRRELVGYLREAIGVEVPAPIDGIEATLPDASVPDAPVPDAPVSAVTIRGRPGGEAPSPSEERGPAPAPARGSSWLAVAAIAALAAAAGFALVLFYGESSPDAPVALDDPEGALEAPPTEPAAPTVEASEPAEPPEEPELERVEPEVEAPSPPPAREPRSPRRASRPSPRPVAPASPPPEPPPAPEAPVERPAGFARVIIPSRSAVCLDRPCRSSGDVVYGPRTLRVEAGPHRLFFVDAEAAAEDTIVARGEREIDAAPGTTVRVAP